jgi:hypothetical protein
MMDAWSGKAASARENEAHAALRGVLLSKGNGRPAAIVATAILPRALRDRLKREMGVELGVQAEGADGGVAAMAGVLGVETAGVAVVLGTGSEDSSAAADFRCESAAACLEVKKLIEKQRLALSGDLGLRLIGLGPLADSMTLDAHDRELTVSTHAPTEAIALGLQHVLDARAQKAARAAVQPSAPPPPPPALPLLDAGERIAPKRDASR